MCVGINKKNLKRMAVVGAGSMGSAVIEMVKRSDADKMLGWQIEVIDPDKFERSNMTRHVLREDSLGKFKAQEMAKLYAGMTYQNNKFVSFMEPPHVIACCADSDLCRQQVNAYALENKIPCVFGSVHGDAHTAEIITVIPGLTPCYACWERNLPEPGDSKEKYTNKDYDPTKTPHQVGLWGDVLMAASVQFRAILGVIEGSGSPQVLAAPLRLVSLRYPYGSESFQQEGGCAVCSENFASLTV